VQTVEIFFTCDYRTTLNLHWQSKKAKLTYMDPLALIESHAAELRALGAQRIGVFGSFSREKATAESDVDVYLEFAKGRKTYDNFFAIYELLEGLFGKPLDLVTDGSLSERKAHILLPSVRYAILNAFLLRMASCIDDNREQHQGDSNQQNSDKSFHN
jgi:hypothetical protein